MSNLATTKLDASILSFIPRSTYYISLDDQFKSIEPLWENLLNADRDLFALLMLLPGTHYAKGRMAHYLLSNLRNGSIADLDSSMEDRIIIFNLQQMPMASALRTLLFLAGQDHASKKLKRVNNVRSRRIITNYIFDRDQKSLEAMVIKYKSKIAKLLRHVFGASDLHRILSLDTGYRKLLNKYCRHLKDRTVFDHNTCLAVMAFAFNKSDLVDDFPLSGDAFRLYKELQESAKTGDITKVNKVLEKGILPFEIALGFRNCYKLKIDLSVIHEKGKKSEQTKFRTMEASKKQGVEVDVDFTKQPLKDLYKYIYFKHSTGEGLSTEEYAKLPEALKVKLAKEEKFNLDLGKTVVIIDSSDSMRGHQTRPYHPIITALLVANKLPGVEHVIFSSDNEVYFDPKAVDSHDLEMLPLVAPSGRTELWTALLQAVSVKPDTVVVISDGYENTIAGMFEHIYNHLVMSDYRFRLIQVNPVYDASSKGGRSLVSSLEPLNISEPEMLETTYVLTQIGQDMKNVKRLLAGIFNKKIGGNSNELLIK